MAAEVSGSCLSLRAELESARLGLQRLERDIRRVHHNTKRFHPDRNQDRSFPNQTQGNPRGGQRPPAKGNFYSDTANNQRPFNEERLGKKRPQETKTVFSRLSARPTGDSDVEEETNFNKKPRLSSQVIRDLPTKQEVLKAQSGDEESKARNKRMFGSLLGTLQKFKQEAIVLQNKEDKKAQVEKKIEEQAKQEKENQKKERQNLFAEREIKKATIKALEAKMVRMREFEKWEIVHKTMLNFIQTKGKPHIFWKPKKMTERAEEKLNISKKNIEKIIEKKKQDVSSELNAIEQRCIRNIKLPPGSHSRPASLSFSQKQNYEEITDADNMDQNDEETSEGVGRLSVKHEKDDSLQKDKSSMKSEVSAVQVKHEAEKVTNRKVENGKSSSGEKWNREDSESSSDENSADNGEDPKDHSMDESSQHVEDNGGEDPGGASSANDDRQTKTGEEMSSLATETDSNQEK